MDRLIQMGKDLGFKGEKMQGFVKQQQHYERVGRIAERELEWDRIAAQDNDRELERNRIAAQDKDRELEEANIATNERFEMARMEGIAEQA